MKLPNFKKNILTIMSLSILLYTFLFSLPLDDRNIAVDEQIHSVECVCLKISISQFLNKL